LRLVDNWEPVVLACKTVSTLPNKDTSAGVWTLLVHPDYVFQLIVEQDNWASEQASSIALVAANAYRGVGQSSRARDAHLIMVPPIVLRENLPLCVPHEVVATLFSVEVLPGVR